MDPRDAVVRAANILCKCPSPLYSACGHDVSGARVKRGHTAKLESMLAWDMEVKVQGEEIVIYRFIVLIWETEGVGIERETPLKDYTYL